MIRMKVIKNRIVTIEYRMVDQQGDLVDSTDDGTPLSFIQGNQSVLPAIENAVDGREAGERLTFTLPPEKGYGSRDLEKVTAIPREQFNFDGELHAGMQFYTQKNGLDIPVIITAVDDQKVTVDGNHPLAGETMNIDLVIVEVREATATELESGKIQLDEELFAL